MGSAEVCKDELRAATACMLAHPASDWECSPQGLAAIKSGICDSEQQKVMNCMMAEVPR
jgi:hypothetical protein